MEYIRNKKLTFNIQILQNLLTIALAFSIAIEKKTRLNRAQTLKQKGVLIIFDRLIIFNLYEISPIIIAIILLTIISILISISNEIIILSL